jgi:hypothetical protein
MNERIINKIDNAIDSRLPQSNEAIRRRKNRILKPVAALAIAGFLVGGYKTIEHAIAMPSFSEETHTLIAEPGEGIQSIVRSTTVMPLATSRLCQKMLTHLQTVCSSKVSPSLYQSRQRAKP